METQTAKSIKDVYWKCFLSWNGKRQAFAKYKKKRLLAIATYQAHRYFDKWAACTDFNKVQIEYTKNYWLR